MAVGLVCSHVNQALHSAWVNPTASWSCMAAFVWRSNPLPRPFSTSVVLGRGNVPFASSACLPLSNSHQLRGPEYHTLSGKQGASCSAYTLFGLPCHLRDFLFKHHRPVASRWDFPLGPEWFGSSLSEPRQLLGGCQPFVIWRSNPGPARQRQLNPCVVPPTGGPSSRTRQ